MTVASTIFALSSGQGRAAVAVIRVSGPKVRNVMVRMAPPEIAPRRAAFRTIRHPATGEALDKAVVLWFAAPQSETGEDVCELQLHGGRAVVRAVLDALGGIDGCRLAEPGEFARRAFYNGKLDLAEVEGIADLVDAETEAQRRQALAQSGGALSRLYDGWRERLIEIAALTEAAIDFSDEGDVASSALDDARRRASKLAAEISAQLEEGHRGEILRDGFQVALLGAPNSGKSSLLNALAKRDAAIVSEEAGTTRDVIQVRLDLGGVPVVVSDTAGIREAAGRVEQEGIRRSLETARRADLVIWLSETERDSAPSEISRETIFAVRSKSDLVSTAPSSRPSLQGERVSALSISTKTGDGLAALVEEIARHAVTAAGDPASPVVTQVRQRQLLERALIGLEAFIAGDGADPELRAEDLRKAIAALGRITGRVDAEDVLGQIFSRFCIGK